MSKRLGFISLTEEVKVLINDLTELLQDFGFDFTLFMRRLNSIYSDTISVKDICDKLFNEKTENKNKNLFDNNDHIKDMIVFSLNYQNKLKKIKPKLEAKAIETLRKIAVENPSMLYGIGVDPKFVEFQGKLLDNYSVFIENYPSKEKYEETKERKLRDFIETWRKIHLIEIKNIKKMFDENLMNSISDLLFTKHIEYIYNFPLNEGVCRNTLLSQFYKEKSFFTTTINSNEVLEKIILFKLNTMDCFNPIYALRRHVLQSSIYDAEENKYEKLKQLNQVLTEPFSKSIYNDDSNFDILNPPNLNECNEVCLSCSS